MRLIHIVETHLLGFDFVPIEVSKESAVFFVQRVHHGLFEKPEHRRSDGHAHASERETLQGSHGRLHLAPIDGEQDRQERKETDPIAGGHPFRFRVPEKPEIRASIQGADEDRQQQCDQQWRLQ